MVLLAAGLSENLRHYTGVTVVRATIKKIIFVKHSFFHFHIAPFITHTLP